MTSKNIINSSLLVCFMFFVSCAGTTEHQYKNQVNSPMSELPQKIYVESQIGPLHTDGPLPDSRSIFVEVRTFDGTQEKGKLIEINENSLIMSSSFHFAANKDSTTLKEHKIEIPKDTILILKMW